MIIIVEMASCPIHKEFFDDECPECKKEYLELKGYDQSYSNAGPIPSNYAIEADKNKIKKNTYKEFNEVRAKKLYEELILQYLRKSKSEMEAVENARSIIRKQCKIRNIPTW